MSPFGMTDPPPKMPAGPTPTMKPSGLAWIQAVTFSGVLLASQGVRMAGSPPWSVLHRSSIERRSTVQAASASSGRAGRKVHRLFKPVFQFQASDTTELTQVVG